MAQSPLDWFEQAKRDLNNADYLLKGGRFEATAFMCQQSLEKGFKALILKIKKDSPGPIHSLVRLGILARAPSKFNGFLRSLSAEYIMSRYPDVAEGVPYKLYSREVVFDYVVKCQEVLKWIHTQMKK